VQRYGLPPHVFVAFDGTYSVWLDIRRDRYFATAYTRNWPEEVIASLVKSGLLVDRQDHPGAKSATAVSASACSGEIRLPVLRPTPRIRLHHVLNITAAWIIGAATLKFRGLAGAIARMRSRSARLDDEDAHPLAHTISGEGANIDERSLQELISAFALLRPFFFALRGRCLLSSVVLSEFLARYGMRSQCVLGVKARPFAAHCWLECGGRVLNDSVERVRAFTPILRA
jgi:hypothetical protein